MSHDEEQQRRSRVVVETPTARREVVHSQTTRYPERQGFSTGMVAAVALTAIAATAIIFLWLTNPSGDDASGTNVNVRATTGTQPTPITQVPVIVQSTPLVQPTPIIIQQAPPMTTTAPPPVIITQPAPATTTTTAPATVPPTATSGADDVTLQSNIDRIFLEDTTVAGATIDASVANGKVTLTGTVDSPSIKQRAERLARGVKGVSSVENRITVSAP